jgi:hypothetical protein
MQWMLHVRCWQCTLWDVLSWGGETQALIYNPKSKKVIAINALGVIDCSTIFTTGYTASSATLLSLLQKEYIAIVDRAVHTSVFEGLMMTNVRMLCIIMQDIWNVLLRM